MKKTEITCDLSSKKWLNMDEASAYLGFGSKNTFQQWRDNGLLAFYKLGNTIFYKRADLDKFAEKYRFESF